LISTQVDRDDDEALADIPKDGALGRMLASSLARCNIAWGYDGFS
jgi:hypothetical protein